MQLSLLDGETPEFDPQMANGRRIELSEGCWIDHVPSWLKGHRTVFRAVADSLRWRTGRRWMYERHVAVPRMMAAIPDDGVGHPILSEIVGVLSRRYGAPLESVSAALYRDGRDSVAWHRDKVIRDRPHGFVVTLSLGGPRTFMVRPHGGGRSISFSLGWGDLLVMGGACQRDWEHCVPKTRHAEPRITVMFRERYEGTPQAPIISYPGGAAPSSKNGMHVWPSAAPAHTSPAAGSSRSQNSVQQPLEPTQPGTRSGMAQNRPGSHTLKYSQGSA